MWTRFSKRTGGVALGLVAILSGVAVAYFLTETTYAGNTAVGGQLTVSSNLPLVWTDPLYPINNPDTDGGAYSQTMTITNNNTVPVDYKMFASCNECNVPAGTTPSQAQADKIDQFNNLYVEIDEMPQTACTPPNSVVNPLGGPTTTGLFPCPGPIYRGPLSGMDATHKQSLTQGANACAHEGTAACPLPAGGSRDFRVRLWLKNDPGRAQPQSVQSIWEFFLDGQTPA
ncbi:MAG TPA: hypothetical protein VFA94_02505 [Acidimicrobiales bacterium]|nr:hypothetical protein [Acidimicrobiales bacterium]